MIVSVLDCAKHGRKGIITLTAVDNTRMKWVIKFDGDRPKQRGIGTHMADVHCDQCPLKLTFWAIAAA